MLRHFKTVDEAFAFVEQCCEDKLRALESDVLTAFDQESGDADVDDVDALLQQQRAEMKDWLEGFRHKLVFFSTHERWPDEEAV